MIAHLAVLGDILFHFTDDLSNSVIKNFRDTGKKINIVPGFRRVRCAESNGVPRQIKLGFFGRNRKTLARRIFNDVRRILRGAHNDAGMIGLCAMRETLLLRIKPHPIVVHQAIQHLGKKGLVEFPVLLRQEHIELSGVDIGRGGVEDFNGFLDQFACDIVFHASLSAFCLFARAALFLHNFRSGGFL